MRLSKDERLQKSIKNHPEWKDHRHAKSIKGCRVVDVKRIRDEIAAGKIAKPTKKLGMSESDFMRRYDPVTKVRAQIASAVQLIERGRYYIDFELRRGVGCSDHRLWREIARDPSEGFTAYQFEIGNDLIWSDKRSALRQIETNPKAKAVGV